VTGTAQVPLRAETEATTEGALNGEQPRYGVVLAAAVPVLTVTAFLVAVWTSEPFRDGVSRIATYLPVALYVAVAVLLTLSVLMSRDRRRADAMTARLGRARFLVGPTALTGCVIAYLSSLVENWETGRRRFFTIAGVVPWSDAQAYFLGAERVLFDGKLDAFNSVRPLNTEYLAVRLALTGLDLRKALVIQAIMLGVACYLAARVVAKDLGPIAGFALFAGVYGFAAFHVESTLTETLGVTFGCLAFAVLWRAFRERSAALATGGLFLLGIGLVVRAGTIAVLVVLPIWFAWHLRSSQRLNWRMLVLGVAAVAAAFAVNYGVILSLRGDTRAPNSNFGYVMYGLATGYPGWDATHPAWTRAYIDYPAQMARKSLTDRAQFASSRARDEIKSHPGRFAKAVARSGLNYAKLSRDTATEGLGDTTLRLVYGLAALGAVAFLIARWRSSRWWALVDAALAGCAIYAIPALVGSWPDNVHAPSWFPVILVGFMVAAVLARGTARLRSPALVSFTLAAFFGMIVSTPFLSDGTSGVRVFAATIPFFALPFVLSVAVLSPRMHGTSDDKRAPDSPAPKGGAPIALVIGLALVAVVVIGGPVAAAFVSKPAVRDRTCPDGRPAKAFIGGEAVQLVSDSADRDLDQFKISRFDPGQLDIRGLLAGARPGDTIMSVLDDHGATYIVVVPGRRSAPRSAPLYLCGSKVSDATTRSSAELYGAPLNVFVGRPLEP
jgi:hypothetical protein